ncbi:MAG: UDP-N-acetylmuramoyl-tripeptide--D-alanyl-D-alanine ligase [Terrimicrobiaceae bacterium]|nr:UDP-N-acetylmuramoyl-tripeptide--D-alanyl-D-alanine ligase [Terrimicrobiaceae bacterium]
MDPLTITELAELAGAEILRGPESVRVSRISKDTRTLQTGDLYWSLRGGKFDGNVFAADAVAKGAAAVLVDDPEAAAGLDVPVLRVSDGLEALTRLARGWRQRLNLRVLAITGSNGKTSTKQFAAAVLASRYEVTKTEGNLNNHIGVPLSILAANSSHSAAVWEVAMNHPGEIAPLADLARPEAAIITGIGVAHIEYMKTREAIALEKGMLAEAIPSTGVVVLSADCDMSESIARRTKARVVLAGLDGGSLQASQFEESEDGLRFVITRDGRSYPASIPANGTHMARNAVLALVAGIELGVDIEAGIAALATAPLAGGRLERKVIQGVVFIDDTYNANPDSMEAALVTLRGFPGNGRRIAVLGAMGELGDYAAEGCRRVGTTAGGLVDILVTVGAAAAPIAAAARDAGLGRIHEVDDTASAALMLRNLARPGDIVLVKGSRSARMEGVIHHYQT